MDETYEITQERLEEYIAYLELDVGSDIVSELAVWKCDSDDIKFKALLQRYIDKYTEKYKLCPSCFNDNVVERNVKERHYELDGHYYEEYADGYACRSCNSEFDY